MLHRDLPWAAPPTAALVCENEEKQESQEASRLAVWNNRREYASESIARSSAGDASLLSDRAGNVSGGG